MVRRCITCCDTGPQRDADVALCNYTVAGISALQFQAVQMACAKHETFLADGKTRAGFFLGDGLS